MSFDVMFIGPACKDVNTDYTGKTSVAFGGAAYFGEYSARAMGGNVFVSLKINPEDKDAIAAYGLDKDHLKVLASKETTAMKNTYFTADRERRKSEVASQADPILPEEIPDVDCSIYHLAGLLYGDFGNEMLVALSKKGKVSADMQGFLRHNENGKVAFYDWADKDIYLPYITYLKADANEAEILTGTNNRRKAADMLYQMGAKEIFISHNQEMLVYDGEEYHTCPVKARNLSGRTGRGDTVFSAYLVMRNRGADIDKALLYATAAVSLKMETPGPLKATIRDVETYINEFYKN